MYVKNIKNGFVSGAVFRGVAPHAKAATLCIALFWSNVAAAENQAGTQISNTAELSYGLGGTPFTIRSNRVDFTVAERLDVALSAKGSVPVTADGTSYIAALVLKNLGNGAEAFSLDASLNSADYTIRAIAIDSDNDGRYDPARDQLIAAGQSPVLQPGQSVSLLVLIDPTGPAANPDAVRVTVVTRAVTGSGPVGTVFPGRGDGGADAVTGPTGAEARVVLPLVTDRANVPTFVKSQAVLAPDGSARPLRDAVITYTLTATFPSATTGARIGDLVPDGTTYVPGSLRLDAVSLSDAADADAGLFDGSSVLVALGDIPGAATRTVQFQVKIK